MAEIGIALKAEQTAICGLNNREQLPDLPHPVVEVLHEIARVGAPVSILLVAIPDERRAAERLDVAVRDSSGRKQRHQSAS